MKDTARWLDRTDWTQADAERALLWTGPADDGSTIAASGDEFILAPTQLHESQVSGGADSGGQDTTTAYAVDFSLDSASPATSGAGSTNAYYGGNEYDDYIIAGPGSDHIWGFQGNDTLFGNRGEDTLDGGIGADVLAGGADNDTYVVDSALDLIWNEQGFAYYSFYYYQYCYGGWDTVLASASYTLPGNVEQIQLTGNANISATGNSGDNVLAGNNGANVLDGAGGADTMYGSPGNDIYLVDSALDVVTGEYPYFYYYSYYYGSYYLAGGWDSVISSQSFTLGSALESLDLAGTASINATGNEANNELYGNPAANVLDGGAGADYMEGGSGDDTYVVDDALDSISESSGTYYYYGFPYYYNYFIAGGWDTVQSSIDFTLGDYLEALVLTGAEALDGTGNALGNSITGNAAANLIDGGAGVDTLVGGGGDDTYKVDQPNDTITEAGGGGTDTVLASVNYTLGAEVENLQLTGAALHGSGNTLANTLTGTGGNNSLSGGASADTLQGGSGKDTLNGGTGIDSLTGGPGDDVYVVDAAGDIVVEEAAGGVDTVNASTSVTLGAEIERLVLSGSAGNGGTGNSLANLLTGNTGANALSGAGSNDTLNGNDGADTLDGGDGSDQLNGGVGNDVLQGGAGAGDIAVFKGNAASYDVAWVAGELVVTDLASTDGADTLSGIEVLRFADGDLDPPVQGGTAGNDSLVGGTGADTLEGLDGDDSLTGDAGDDTLGGGNGADTLDGGLGNDSLTGGAGDDVFVVDAIGDTLVEGAAGGIDTVRSSVSWTLGAEFESLVLLGEGNLTGTGNTLANTITGTGGDDTLNGGAGADQLAGGLGNDVYVVAQAGDVTTEAPDAGTDTVRSTISWTLAANLEVLELTGTGAINGTGNAAANTLTGNSGANTLDGGGGADAMAGGGGNDTYITDGGDTLSENADAGTDLVRSSVSHTLGTNFENLLLLGGGNLRGTGNAVGNRITGNTGDNTLDGGSGVDTLIGGLGNDSLVGSGGGDSLSGGDGNDTMVGGLANDILQGGAGTADLAVFGGNRAGYQISWNAEGLLVVQDTNVANGDDGTDTLSDVEVLRFADGDIAPPPRNGTPANDTLLGGTGNDTFQGLAGDDSIDGGAGNDTLDGGDGNDTIDGGAGDDALDGGLGLDTLSYASASGAVTIDLRIATAQATGGAGSDTQAGFEHVLGGDFADRLTGSDLANSLSGGAGNDTLDGGAGADTLTGGADNDTYIINASGDTLVEQAGGGTDGVRSSITYSLADRPEIENLELTGSTAINGTGNAKANTLLGNIKANVLDGGAGADVMTGFGGNDTYVVDDAGDAVSEAPGGGTDTVRSAVDFDLGTGGELENLELTGTAINGTGNAFDNAITGNASDNRLDGGEGADLLDGRVGADTLVGGGGDDVFIVDNQGDDVQEGADAGSDTVRSSLEITVLAANVEILELSGSTAYDGTGNALRNVLTGNLNSNRLDGGGDADTMAGGRGDDIYVVDSDGDVITEDITGGSSDTVEVLITDASVTYSLADAVENLILKSGAQASVVGNSLGNQITGNSLANSLDGGAGSDLLIGGGGNDTYFVDQTADTVDERAGGGTADEVKSSVTYTLTDVNCDIERLTLTGSATINGTGNSLANTITGQAGANLLEGQGGNDTLFGGDGDDQLLGGSGNDSLDGGAGADTLDGGVGRDTLVGGTENDTYYVDYFVSDADKDTVVEQALGGSLDEVRASVSFTLPANVEKLVLTGASGINGAGNELDNDIDGNDGNNILNGAAGNDTLDGSLGVDSMDGGAGDDIYYVNVAEDIAQETTNAALLLPPGSPAPSAGGTNIDTVISQVSYTLRANIENLELVEGAGNLTGTGNELDNLLSGNSGNNLLSGLDGVDILDGGGGNDTLVGGAGSDTLGGGAGDDLYRVTAGDSVLESSNNGTDTVESAANWTLGDAFEKLVLTGATNVSATGSKRANTLVGNDGNNVLNGKAGVDTMTGGLGADTFAFDTALASNIDLIKDFTPGTDRIRLDQTIFTGVPSTLAPANFHAGAGFTTAGDADDRIIYNTTNGALYYDGDGTGGTFAPVRFATLGTAPQALSAGDFVIVA